MNENDFDVRIRKLQDRLDELERAAAGAAEESGAVSHEALEDLRTALEEIHVAEEELRQQSEESEKDRRLYEELFEFAPDGYVVADAKGVITEANRAAGELLNISHDRLIGKPLYLLVAKEDRNDFHHRLSQLAEKGGTRRWEIRLQPREKSAFPAAITVEPIQKVGLTPSGFRMLIRDVSQQKRAEEILSFQAGVLSQISDAVIAIDNENRITYWNQAAEQLYGISASEAVGKKLEETYSYRWIWPEDEQDANAALASTGAWRGENIHETAGGKEIHVFSTLTLLRNTAGEQIGIAAAIRDITERKRREEELARQRSLLQRIIDNIPVLLILWDSRLQRFTLNRHAESVLGWTTADANEGDFMSKVYPDPSYRAEVTAYMQSLESGWREWSAMTRDGKRVPIDWSNIPLEHDSRIGIGLDLRERKRAEKGLARQRQAEAALARLSFTLLEPTSIEDISNMVLETAKQLTESAYGFVAYRDIETGDQICPTLTKDVWSECDVPGKGAVFKDVGAHSGLAGWVWEHGKPVLTNDVAIDPRSKGVPEGHVKIHRFLGVPALIEGSLVGQIALANSRRDYSERDVELIQRMAGVYALALQRNRMETDLKRNRVQLEELVEGRTIQLSATVKELDKHIEELQRKDREIGNLSWKVLTAQENERKMIAQDLHDSMGANLSAIKFRLEQKLSHGEGTLEDLISMTHDAITEMRRIIRRLRPSILDDLGIVPALEWLCGQFGEDYPHIRTEHLIEVRPEDVPEPLKIVIFRILEEALQNAARHSGASLVRVSLQKTDAGLGLSAADNGRGFDAVQLLETPVQIEGFGIHGMMERARLSGGSFQLDSAPGKGTTVTVTWPA